MSIQSSLNLPGFHFTDLFKAPALHQLDQRFIKDLQSKNKQLHDILQGYRKDPDSLSNQAISQLIIAVAIHLDDFLSHFFSIQDKVQQHRANHAIDQPIFDFKTWYVLKQAKRRLKQPKHLKPFLELDAWLNQSLADFSSLLNPSVLFNQSKVNDCGLNDRELAVARLGMYYLSDPVKYEQDIEQLIQWCVQAFLTVEGQQAVSGWVSFDLPQKYDFDKLVQLNPIPRDPFGRQRSALTEQRYRESFDLTDKRFTARQVASHVHYCVYCHKNAGDFCSKGFPVKKNHPDLGLKSNPLGEVLTGCPLEEKISEMHVLKRDGYSIGALATIMIDNPMCPVTGHRICNDCMKACIYQKQTPVNIPQIETRVLTDVLSLPWGVEIYDLLTRWNPLRPQQWVAKPYNGLKALVMGMGPAGFTLAHHLLMEGFAVVGMDGLKIESLPKALWQQPIKSYASLCESLSTRLITGFGGVAEYGITARWDKNFLKLIYISLMRRPYFQLFGSVRFGGTITVEDAWDLGFDHLALAVGSGLPRALPIPGSLAPGMRQANDFLMALQLTGAAKQASLANLQLRLPVVVVGSGLTAIDAATEAQAYYIVQIEKIVHRYETLVAASSEEIVRALFLSGELKILDGWLLHGRAVRDERRQAKLEERSPNLLGLIHQWGGVTVVYRRSLQESPAYRLNHEELKKALEEGVYYREALAPISVDLDDDGQASGLVCCIQAKDEQEQEQWQPTEKRVTLPARSILVATGAKPNVAYAFEHAGTFDRSRYSYHTFDCDEPDGHASKVDTEALHCKSPVFGPFTSYQKGDYRVTLLGDTHPVFHGSVVKAIASAKRTYPAIVKLFKQRLHTQVTSSKPARLSRIKSYSHFRQNMQNLLQAKVLAVKPCTPKIVEVVIQAPLATRHFRPGQFYRVQNFESNAQQIRGNLLQTEAMALAAARVDKASGIIHFIVKKVGASSCLMATWTPGQVISVMGPTGVRNKIPKEPQPIVLISDDMGIPQVCSLGLALREAGHWVLLFLDLADVDELHHQVWLQDAADQIVWLSNRPSFQSILPSRPQDRLYTTTALNALMRYAKNQYTHLKYQATEIQRVVVTGKSPLVRGAQALFRDELKTYFTKEPNVVGSVYGPMQCMLKGICAQCLQWQVDPDTQKRTKAVYACSWQDQPIDRIDMGNLDERLSQNRVQEKLTNIWLDYLLEKS